MRVEKKEPEKKIEKFIPPQPMGKIILLIILAVASAVLFWLTWQNALTTGISLDFAVRNVIVIISTLLAFCLMFCFVALAEMVITKKIILLGMVILVAGTMFLFTKPTLWSFIAFLLVFLAFMYWRREIRLDEKTRNKFVPQRIINSGLKTTVTLILIAASFVYYNFLVTKPNANEKILEDLSANGATVVENLLTLYYKDGFSPKMTLDEFLSNITLSLTEKVEDTINEQIKEEVDVIEGEQAEQVLEDVISQGLTMAQQETVDEVRTSFLGTFDIEANGNETMAVVINRIAYKNISKYIDPYLKFIPALLAFGLFFVLNILSFIYRELIKSLGYIVFHILVWLKFLKIKKIQVEAEKITLSDGTE